jgi:tRNA(fMet)-specific endonuclease VapC
MNFLLDTNIFIHLIRNSKLSQSIEERLQLWNPENKVYISAVTKGELLSFAKQSHWGDQKIKKLHELLTPTVCIPVNGDSPIMDAYADIDTYSQTKHKIFPYPAVFTARNMGKNDLWIAATAFLYGLPLLTSDNDFDHLHPHLIEVKKF